MSNDDSGGNCLAISSGSVNAVFEKCCPTATSSGKGSMDGIMFTYTCGLYTLPNHPAKATANARECAKLCAADPTCPAASWDMGKCYLVKSQPFRTGANKKFVL